MDKKLFGIRKSAAVNFAFILAAALGSFVLAQSAAAQTAANKAINAYIKKQTGDASEYKAARKVIYGDVDGDGDKDAVVQYTLEGMGGGNSFAQMLAVFTNQKGVYKFAAEEVVGGKFAERTSALMSVKRGKIMLDTETCEEPPQGLCENPTKGNAAFSFAKGKLKEL